jgi:hypothetical protein
MNAHRFLSLAAAAGLGVLAGYGASRLRVSDRRRGAGPRPRELDTWEGEGGTLAPRREHERRRSVQEQLG